MSPLKTRQTYKTTESWTDDLPVCKNTGIGFSTNQIYREDGHPQEEHPYEDYSCHFRLNDNFYWYAVFDGHEGKRAADFCSQRLTAEICFSQICEKQSDDEIKEILKQSFITVEKGYMESLGDLLAERTSLQYDIPEGLNLYQAYKKVPDVVEQIHHLNYQLSSGSAAAVALICNQKLFVANVGNCRVLLCQTDSNSVLKVVQLSVDHDLKNEDELLRLSQLGLDVNHFRYGNRLGNQENTRCLGNYAVKDGYKDFEDLRSATAEPIIAVPDIHGGIILDDSCRFLLLMSSGLYKSVEEAIGSEQVNKYIAQCVVEQFREQATLTGVAQAVVDKVVRLHHDWYTSNSFLQSGTPKREDITLVLRNFNFSLPNAIKSPIPAKKNESIGSDSNSAHSTLINCDTNNSLTETSTTISESRIELDNEIGSDQKIMAYVDFADFYRNFEEAKNKNELPPNLIS